MSAPRMSTLTTKGKSEGVSEEWEAFTSIPAANFSVAFTSAAVIRPSTPTRVVCDVVCVWLIISCYVGGSLTVGRTKWVQKSVRQRKRVFRAEQTSQAIHKMQMWNRRCTVHKRKRRMRWVRFCHENEKRLQFVTFEVCLLQPSLIHTTWRPAGRCRKEHDFDKWRRQK